MPIIKDFAVPSAPEQLDVAEAEGSSALVIFISSEDAETRQPWCPDVRAAWPHVEAAFGSADAPKLWVVHVGQRPEWKSPDNVYRKSWNVGGVPTLARYERVDGRVVEVARLDEHGIMDEKRLQALLSPRVATR